MNVEADKLFITLSVLLLMLLWVSTSVALEPIYSLEGQSRNFIIQSDGVGLNDTQVTEAMSLLRLKLFAEISPSVKAEIAYEIIPGLKSNDTNSGSLISSSLSSSQQSYRAADFNAYLYPTHPESEDRLTVIQNLDRAFVSISGERFDLHVGRQPIAFGSARSVNPTDILAPSSYNTILKDERRGVDAVRIKIPTGTMSEVDAGVVLGDGGQSQNSAQFLRTKVNILNTDLSVILINFDKNILLGTDISRSIGGAGTWVEAAYTSTHSDDPLIKAEDYFRITAGVDYNFKGNLYAYIEYHFNGAGISNASGYLSNISQVAYTQGGVYLLGQHYISPAISYELTALTMLKVGALMNLHDNSALLSAGLEHNVAEDMYIGAGMYVARGDEPGVFGVPRSEFGIYSDTHYLYFNYYF